ncbi:MAG: hypothetical protein D6800_06985, partial [Candidatus Zixiibacteriota bacterium]
VIRHGTLQVAGTSGVATDWPESFRAAVVDAVHRHKPLIINQESSEENAPTRLLQSTFVYPFTFDTEIAAILLQRGSQAISVGANELNELETFASLAATGLQVQEVDRLTATRRTGIESILQLLRVNLDAGDPVPQRPLARILRQALPDTVRVISLSLYSDGSAEIITSTNETQQVSLSETILHEQLQDVATQGDCRFLTQPEMLNSIRRSSPAEISACLNADNQSAVGDGFLALCSIGNWDDADRFVLISLPEISETERAEWQQFVKLAVRLFTLRLSLLRLHVEGPRPERDNFTVGDFTNRLNNSLAAIVGKAELAANRADLPEEVRQQLTELITQAEEAASLIRSSELAALSAEDEKKSSPVTAGQGIGAVLRRVLDSMRISGDLYMVT